MMIELVLVSSLVTLILFVYNEFRAYYYIKEPEIHSKETKLSRQLINSFDAIKKPYVPTFWATNCHLQTWLKTFLRFQEQPGVSVTREYLEMYDEGIVSIDWVSKADKVNRSNNTRRRSLKKKSIIREKPILLIIPSALNTSVEDYSNLCLKAISMGFKPLFFNRRGYSETPLTTPKVTTYCDRSDLDETVQFLNNQHPFSDIYAIAFSMESSNLISYLGHKREASHIAGAVCVSSTFGCENNLDDHALKQPYNSIITEKLKTIFQRNDMKMFTNQAVEECHNMVQLQNEIHARSNEYQTLNEYLAYNSPLRHLNRIRVPVLFVQAKDDPVIPNFSIPYEFFGISDSCILVSTEYGGHCGFFQDATPSSWADEMAVEFLKLISQNRKVVSREVKSLFTNEPVTRSRAMTIF